ncbi:hypothetical protein WG901_22775 [Novosphingobium sp. PS1R-30]|uniref:Uncharacterized protein n=1 Tax=Novosphingobium anseongense TaxID=3133436 RepID=A0ABU8S2A9_9SPHN
MEVKLIDWKPFEELPDDRRDPCLMLLCTAAGSPQLAHGVGTDWASDLGFPRETEKKRGAPVFDREPFSEKPIGLSSILQGESREPLGAHQRFAVRAEVLPQWREPGSDRFHGHPTP